MPWLLLQPVKLSVEKRSSRCSDLLRTPEELPGTPPAHCQGEERQACIKQLLLCTLCTLSWWMGRARRASTSAGSSCCPSCRAPFGSHLFSAACP